MSNYSSQFLDMLILAGAVEVNGLDPDTGEFLYNFTPKLEEISPSLFQEISEFFHSAVLDLWEKGFIDMTVTDDEPLVTLTDKVNDLSAIDQLSEQEKSVLRSVVSAFEGD